MMGYYLLDHPNVYAAAWAKSKGMSHRFWGYPSRHSFVRGFVMHVPVALQDIEDTDLTAENVAQYFSTVNRAASAHVNIDADSVLELLPLNYTAFHAKDGNSAGIGIEHGWGHLDWGTFPKRDFEVLSRTAQWIAPIALRYDIPLYRVSRDHWLKGYKGFVAHSDLDPTRRKDPGPNYPWQTLFDLIRLELFMDKLTHEEILWLKAMIAGAIDVGSNPDSLKTLILDYRERNSV